MDIIQCSGSPTWGSVQLLRRKRRSHNTNGSASFQFLKLSILLCIIFYFIVKIKLKMIRILLLYSSIITKLECYGALKTLSLLPSPLKSVLFKDSTFWNQRKESWLELNEPNKSEMRLTAERWRPDKNKVTASEFIMRWSRYVTMESLFSLWTYWLFTCATYSD